MTVYPILQKKFKISVQLKLSGKKIELRTIRYNLAADNWLPQHYKNKIDSALRPPISDTISMY